MARFKLPVWPIQVPQPDDFSITGLQSPFRSHYMITSFTQEKRRQLAKQSAERLDVKGELSGSIYLPDLSQSDDGYKTALQRWTIVLTDSALSESSTTRNLEQAKLNSYKLLKEWWANDGFDSSITQQIRHWIKQAAQLNLDPSISPRLTHSRYNMLLFTLWQSEFQSRHPNKSGIFSQRMMAASEAACHRLATHWVEVVLTTAKVEEPESKRTLLEGQPFKQVSNSLTAAIEPCSWLQSSNESLGSPYYLWDRSLRRAVETSTLKSPAYVAISHTWGRWRKNPSSSVAVEGVPWLVPENTLFDVTSLPMLMDRIPFQERYIWFDLICIPQEMFHPYFGPIANAEIANQATIFRSASHVCAWFNWVPSWTGLQFALRWLSLVYTECNDAPESVLRSAWTDARKSAEKTTHLLLSSNKSVNTIPQTDERDQPSVWFTSLWTLQEVCLRPDMLLCDKEWNLCMSNDSFAVPLDHIVALWTSVYEAIGRHQQDWPRSAREIHTLLTQTGMGELPRMDPLTVLMLGNQRYCEDKRAEAIMSVLDVKDWFRGGAIPEALQQPVLGRYPFAFVEELRCKLGGRFFASSDLHYEAVNEIGTLLPFSDKLIRHRCVFFNGGHEVEDHPSVVTWMLLPDGSISMPKVGIVAAYPISRNRGELARAVIPVGMPDTVANGTQEVELDKFLGSFMIAKHKYAISLLCSGETRQNGLILVEADSSEYEGVNHSPGSKFFRKLGVFFFNMNDDDHKVQRKGQAYMQPISEDVRWIVL